MYYIVTVKDTVRVPPNKLGEEIEKVVFSELEDAFVGKIFSIDENIKGAFILVYSIKEIGEGKILLGDAGVFYNVVFDAIFDAPTLNEVVEGDVKEIREFGSFVDIGAFDGLCHVSQIMEDYISYDGRNSILVGKQTHNSIKLGDIVKARVIAVSMKENTLESKIGLTMRQPYLGKDEWLKKSKTATANAANANIVDTHGMKSKNQKLKNQKNKEFDKKR